MRKNVFKGFWRLQEAKKNVFWLSRTSPQKRKAARVSLVVKVPTSYCSGQRCGYGLVIESPLGEQSCCSGGSHCLNRKLRTKNQMKISRAPPPCVQGSKDQRTVFQRSESPAPRAFISPGISTSAYSYSALS